MVKGALCVGPLNIKTAVAPNPLLRFADSLKNFLESVSGKGMLIPSSPQVREIPGTARGTQISVSDENVDLGAFEPVSGLVTRELRPTTGSTFTCHAFSKDGDRLVTGESNGSLRLWNTFDYQCTVCWSHGSGNPVSAVSFSEGDIRYVIAVDKAGSLCRFIVTKDVQIATDGTIISPTPIQPEVGSDENLGNHPEALMHQFSSDGDVLISTNHKMTVSGPGDTVVNVIKIVDHRCFKAAITMKNAPACVPILARNGKSLLLLCPPRQGTDSPSSAQEVNRRTGIWIVPYLDPLSPYHTERQIPGDRASWGRMGEYLLVWSMEKDVPKLEVYETKLFMPDKSRDPYSLAERRLTHGLTRWMAKMFDEEPDDGSIKVMICESGEDSNIFSVWDVEQDTVTKEVKMMLSPGKSMAEKMTPEDKEKTLRSRFRLPPSPENDFIETVLWDRFPDVCGGVDKNWFGAASWLYQTVSLSSVKFGVTAWVSDFADELVERPMSMPSEVMFDPTGRHMLLFGEHVIQAFAPPFLDEHFEVGRHIEELDQKLTFLDDEERRVELLDAYRCLPSAALARAWEIGTSAKGRSLAWFRRRRDVYRGETVIDAGLSDDGQLLALILRDFSGSLCASVRTAGFTASQRQDDREEVQFPINVEWRDHEFSPERVFLFKTLDEEDCLAFVTTEEDPVAVFCSVYGGVHEVVRLSMTTCLKICKKAATSNVLLLDKDGVCFLSLTERRIIERVPYRTDFAGLTDDVQGALKWYAGRGEGGNELPQDCGISANGQLVLLAWDALNNRSIIVTPAMRQEECRRNIQASKGSLSEFCTLSPTGEFTAFLNVDDLSQGRLTVGIFSESTRRVICHADVDRNLPDDMSSECLQKMLTNLFYGFTKDETKLIVNTVGVSSPAGSHSSSPETSTWSRRVLERGSKLTRSETDGHGSLSLLKDRLIIFQIHLDTRPNPNQDLLRLAEGVTDEALVERLRMAHGVSVFNLPLATNLTVFQDALLNGKNEMKSRLIDLALKQGIKLAVEWEMSGKQTASMVRVPERRISSRRDPVANEGLRPGRLSPKYPTEASTDLLKEALETNRTNDIKEAVRLVCSEIAPFGSSARIMKKSFRELLKKEYRIMEETLSGDSLLCEVCDLDVHVDFMDPRLRRDGAVHIIATDSFLEWSEVPKRRVLYELWRSKNLHAVRDMEKNDNTSTTEAKLKFVRIKNAAKAGMRGIIRPLLLARAPFHVFNTEVVKSVIQFKWCKIWKKRLRRSLLEYIVFVAVFSCYGVLVAASGNNSIGFSFGEIFNCGLAFVVYCFGGRMMWVEFRQALTFSREGREYFGSFVKGLAHYFFSKWNWLDILSSILLSMTIPALHFASLFDSELKKYFAMFVALESILVYAKIWYFVQPFRTTGSLVVMMNSIVRDCASCLMLACVYTVGFGLSLFILFSHVEKKDPEDADKSDDTCGSEEFQNFPKSLLTLFYAFLGSFEPDTYHSDEGLWSWTISLVFVTYLLVQTLLLLNLVLAIMGETYDNVKLTEGDVFLYKQAQHIDALEAELTREQVKAVDSKVGKYVCKLVPADGQDHDEEEGSGRMTMIQTCVQKALQKWDNEEEWTEKMKRIEALVHKSMQDYEKRLEEEFQVNAMEEVRKEMEEIRKEITAQSRENADRMEEMRREIAATSRENARLIEEMRRENTEHMEQIVSLFHNH